MKFWRKRRLALTLAFLLTSPVSGQQAAPQSEKLTFGVEWRLVRAGEVQLVTQPNQINLSLKTAGMVAQLYAVEDEYRANYRPGYCVVDSLLEAKEGRRHRETKVTFDPGGRASFLEKDLTRDTVVLAKEIEIPNCVHDVLGALHRLREQGLPPGPNATFPLSDGKKAVNVRIERQEKETIKTPLGIFPAIRYEAFLFNGVLFARKGRAFIWLTDDEQHVPVQIRVQLPFYIGTVTLQLEKKERF